MYTLAYAYLPEYNMLLHFAAEKSEISQSVIQCMLKLHFSS